MPPRSRVITDKKIDPKSLIRLLKYVWKLHKFRLMIVGVCLIMASVSSVIASTFLAKLIDTVVVPGIEKGLDAVYPDLISIITTMACVYLMGILATALNGQLMAGVGQGTIKGLRDEMFKNMETLPIRYFDSHQHGEIMSAYTNDVDTIRQLVGQSIPNMFQSLLSIIAIYFTMLRYSIWLAIVVAAVILAVIGFTILQIKLNENK